MEPRELAERLERGAGQHTTPEGPEERFEGYGVMGLPFASGHVLALRRFPSSSIGPAYTSVWHRDPAGEWRLYADVEPSRSCPRFFGRQLADAAERSITLDWTGPRSLDIAMSGPEGLRWSLSVRHTMASRLMSAVAAVLPDTVWRSGAALSVMGVAAGALLGVGRVGLHGEVPNGQYFRANPRLMWIVAQSEAAIDGKDLGPPAPLEEQARLGDFWIPQRGILAFGRALFESFDPARHAPVTSRRS